MSDGSPAAVTRISPDCATVGDDDLVLSVYGTGFTESTVILFNDVEVPTEFVGSSQVTTLVKPSEQSGPAMVHITVSNGTPEHFNFAFLPESPLHAESVV